MTTVRLELSDAEKAVAVKIAGWLRMEGRAVQSPEIERMFRVSGRMVRLMVHWLRTQGDPTLSRIASDGDGYRWMSEYDRDVVGNLRARAKSIEAAGVGICRAFGRDWNDPDQTELSL